MDERITGILVRLCLLFGAKRLADLLTVSEENSETEEKFLEAFTRFIEKLERSSTRKSFSFTIEPTKFLSSSMSFNAEAI